MAARSGTSAPARRGRMVYLVGAARRPELITVRGAELRHRDVVLHDDSSPGAPGACRADAEVRQSASAATTAPQSRPSSRRSTPSWCAWRRAARVVASRAATTFLFGRGSEEVESLVAAAGPFEIVPGVTSPLEQRLRGHSLTHRELASSVTFVSGTRAPVPFRLARVAAVRGTICVLMGCAADEVVPGCWRARGTRSPAAVIASGTRATQRVVEAPLGALLAAARAAALESRRWSWSATWSCCASVCVVRHAPAVRQARAGDARRRPGCAHRARPALARRRAGALPTIETVPPPDPARVERAVRELCGYHAVAFT